MGAGDQIGKAELVEIPTKEELLALTQAEDGRRVSIYMPTHQAGPDTRQDPIRLKNLLSQAENDLAAAGADEDEVKRLLAPAWALQDDYEFWRFQTGGLAILAGPDGFRYYRVPIELTEFGLVASRYHLKPLLPLLAADTLFHVLAISMNDVRLLECTAFSEDEVSVPDMPAGMADVLWPGDSERQLQFRSFFAGSSGNTAQFHGAGGSEVDPKNDILRYFREVESALTPFLRRYGGPLVLACVDYLAPLYRDVNGYPHLIADANVSGSPDETPAAALREAAWQIVEPGFVAEREAALERYRSLVGTGKTANDGAEAALSAVSGRVDTAFVTLGVREWGHVDIEAHTVQRHEEAQPGDYDLHDLTAVHTLAAGGTVYVLPSDQAPEPSGIAVVYRY